VSSSLKHTFTPLRGTWGQGGDIKTDQLYTTPSCPQASPSPLGRVWQEQVQEEYYPLGQKAKERPQVMSVVVAYTCNRALKRVCGKTT
jgi:hypothetical protein